MNINIKIFLNFLIYKIWISDLSPILKILNNLNNPRKNHLLRHSWSLSTNFRRKKCRKQRWKLNSNKKSRRSFHIFSGSMPGNNNNRRNKNKIRLRFQKNQNRIELTLRLNLYSWIKWKRTQVKLSYKIGSQLIFSRTILWSIRSELRRFRKVVTVDKTKVRRATFEKKMQ